MTSSSQFSPSDTKIGFDVANWNLRSLLIHPMGIPMASLLNDAIPSRTLLEDFTSNLDMNLEELSKMLAYRGVEVRDSILNSAVSKRGKDDEVKLTQKIMEEIQSKMDNNSLDGYERSNENSLMVESEKNIKSNKNSCQANMDFVVSKKNGDNDNATKRSVVMIIKFGMGHEIWWQKMRQILIYVETLCEGSENDNDITFNQPMLLTIVTVNNSTMNEFDDSIVKVAANKMNDADTDNTDHITEHANIDTHTATATGSDETLVVRYGVFLCTRRPNGDGGGNKYRIALLWRKDASSVDDASIQFGKILYAAQECATLREKFAAQFMESIDGKEALYQYLGPNCCRIGESVSIQMFVLL